jgi:hypothetical protein
MLLFFQRYMFPVCGSYHSCNSLRHLPKSLYGEQRVWIQANSIAFIYCINSFWTVYSLLFKQSSCNLYVHSWLHQIWVNFFAFMTLRYTKMTECLYYVTSWFGHKTNKPIQKIIKIVLSAMTFQYIIDIYGIKCRVCLF